MAMTEYSAFPKAPASPERHNYLLRCHIQNTRWGSLTPLQRSCRCILESQPTGQSIISISLWDTVECYTRNTCFMGEGFYLTVRDTVSVFYRVGSLAESCKSIFWISLAIRSDRSRSWKTASSSRTASGSKLTSYCCVFRYYGEWLSPLVGDSATTGMYETPDKG